VVAARLLLGRFCWSTTLSTVDDVAMHPAEFGNLAATHHLVEIAEGSWKDGCLRKVMVIAEKYQITTFFRRVLKKDQT